MSPSKIVFAQPSAAFGSYVVDANGFQPEPKLTTGIRDFPTPKNITDIRSFFGLCQQVGTFSDLISMTLDPLKPLLKKNHQWE